MKIKITQTDQGPRTDVQYVGPCGSPMAARFWGVLSPPEIERQLKILRALDQQQKKAPPRVTA
jgi:hypothetical protein